MERHAPRPDSQQNKPLNIAPPVTTTAALNAALAPYETAEFVAVDTEFMREKTYYPQLCLIQISDGKTAFAIDPLASDIDLAPLWALMKNPAITKVFHAGGQDMEIFLHLMGSLPTPFYDTQLAAMVCGLGDQVGYDKLVKAMLNIDIDKTSRFTDWSRRPLTDRQIAYALDDVIHLARLYPMIHARLDRENRTHWLDEEYAKSSDPATYITKPDQAWQRLKIRNMRPAALLRLMHLAAWREQQAQKRDLPRNRIMRDETLIDLAGSNPKTQSEFGKIRNFPGGADGKMVHPVLKILSDVAALPASALPTPEDRPHTKRPPAAIVELLRVLLKHVTDAHNIAPRLIASADELELLAGDDNADIRALKGWRRDIFGALALRLKHGEVALALDRKKLTLIDRQS